MDNCKERYENILSNLKSKFSVYNGEILELDQQLFLDTIIMYISVPLYLLDKQYKFKINKFNDIMFEDIERKQIVDIFLMVFLTGHYNTNQQEMDAELYNRTIDPVDFEQNNIYSGYIYPTANFVKNKIFNKTMFIYLNNNNKYILQLGGEINLRKVKTFEGYILHKSRLMKGSSININYTNIQDYIQRFRTLEAYLDLYGFDCNDYIELLEDFYYNITGNIQQYRLTAESNTLSDILINESRNIGDIQLLQKTSKSSARRGEIKKNKIREESYILYNVFINYDNYDELQQEILSMKLSSGGKIKDDQYIYYLENCAEIFNYIGKDEYERVYNEYSDNKKYKEFNIIFDTYENNIYFNNVVKSNTRYEIAIREIPLLDAKILFFYKINKWFLKFYKRMQLELVYRFYKNKYDQYFIMFSHMFKFVDISSYDYQYLELLSKIMASKIYDYAKSKYRNEYTLNTAANNINLVLYSNDSDISHISPRGSHFFDIIQSYRQEYNLSRNDVFEMIKYIIIKSYEDNEFEYIVEEIDQVLLMVKTYPREYRSTRDHEYEWD